MIHGELSNWFASTDMYLFPFRSRTRIGTLDDASRRRSEQYSPNFKSNFNGFLNRVFLVHY